MSSLFYDRFRASLFLLISIFVCANARAQVQVAGADMKGTVFDPSKAVVAGAMVTATNVSTGIGRSTMSDGAGEYRIALLQPGEYELRVEAKDFGAQRRRHIMLTVGETAVI